MPFWSVACTCATVSIWAATRTREKRPPTVRWPSGAIVSAVRTAFLAVVVGTVSWSWFALSHVVVCSDDGKHCVRFEGAMQLTTFTRWCWMLQGVYYALAVVSAVWPGLSRTCAVLHEVSLATALLVTGITYGVLVPCALLLEQPDHRRGSIQLLLTPQGHIMHSANTLFMLVDTKLTGPAGRVWLSDLRYGIAFGVTYSVFEWWFHHVTGLWHYPFMDYNQPFAELAYLALFAVLLLCWMLAAAFTGEKNGCGPNFFKKNA